MGGCKGSAASRLWREFNTSASPVSTVMRGSYPARHIKRLFLILFHAVQVKGDLNARSLSNLSSLTLPMMDSSDKANSEYSVLDQCEQLLQSAILKHHPNAKLLPPNAAQYAEKIQFTGSRKPSIPVNWRFAESIGVLKALEGVIMNALLHSKYGIGPLEVTIDVDHAQLFILSSMITKILVPGQKDVNTSGFATKSIFPSCDLYRNSATPYRTCAGNLYRTKDDRYFHLHSDLNPDVIQDALGLPHDVEGDYDDVYKVYEDKTLQYTSTELDELASKHFRRSGTVAMSVEEYQRTAHGRANVSTGLWEIHEHPNSNQKPGWWPSSPQTSVIRPLAGLKVVDFSRIIAAPTATRGLAEYGASVMRVTASHLPDMGFLHPDMAWGKWNTSLDFRNPDDVQKVKELILDADVIVYGYRPQVSDKYGLGEDDVLELCAKRDRGIIILRLNCYGWVGPDSHRSGWQQISDACCGTSLAYGRAIHGRDEPVTPMFPNSDHCSGLSGHLGVIAALLRRADRGGSYTVSASLNAYSQWLTRQVGEYPPQVWEEVWARHGWPTFRHYHPMQYIWPRGIKLLREHTPHMLDPKYFEVRDARVMGCKVECVKPVLRFPEGTVKLCFQVSARTNGIDEARWPEDLLVDRVD